jgi:hypothetical protein
LTRYIHAVLRCAGVLVLVAIATVPPHAQIASSSDLRVSVTVARSCTLSTAPATADASLPDSFISVKCAEGATPAKPQVSVIEQAAPPIEQDVDGEESLPAEDSSTTLVIVNF